MQIHNKMNRRVLLKSTAALAGTATLASFGLGTTAYAASQEPALIYISPLKSNGSLSHCQAEVWYVSHAGSHYVVTASDAWRAQAVEQNLATAKVWVGDVGVWDDSDGAYIKLPSYTGAVSFERDPAMHSQLLQKFGAKYTREWGTWGPRFERGLADESRVMLKYTPV